MVRVLSVLCVLAAAATTFGQPPRVPKPPQAPPIEERVTALEEEMKALRARVRIVEYNNPSTRVAAAATPQVVKLDGPFYDGDADSGFRPPPEFQPQPQQFQQSYSSGTCVGGSCSPPQARVSGPVWYPGRNLRRR